MIRRFARLSVLAVFAAVMVQATTLSVAGQQASLPTGREIVARHVEVTGGADAITKTQSWHARGSFELPGQGVTGTIEIFSARPAKSLVIAVVPEIGDIRSGYDGKTAWTLDPLSGPSLQTGRALQQAADDAVFDSVLHGPNLVKALTTIEQTTFDGRPAYKVKVDFVSGRDQFEYYDVETGFQIGVEGSRESPLGYVPTITYLRNYQTFGPMKQATELAQQTMGIEQRFRISFFEYDTVPEATFALPPQIQALVKGSGLGKLEVGSQK
jgi:hypothetical protein